MKRFVKLLTLSSLFLSANALALSKDEMDELKEEYVRPTEIPYPESNPYSKEKEALGKFLFFDPRLSKSGTQTCATCHNPSLGWEDGMATGTGHGHEKLGRKTPTILNLAWSTIFMWDGRAPSLEEQSTGPIEAGVEMNMPMDELLTNLKTIEGYKKLFKDAFPNSAEPINKQNLQKAIATYERGVVSGPAPFDKWIEGDETAISKAAVRGFVLFNGKANCSACHSEWNFTDDSFHDIGLASTDIGRGKFDTQRPHMQHAFKTPGLRNISLRGPYMHDGSLKTLHDVVDHYNNGFVKRDSLSSEIFTLNLTKQEKSDLVEFLKTLTGEDKPVTLPVLPQ